MRTTVTLDPDVASRLKEHTRRHRISFKEALNTLVRRGLATQAPRPRHARFSVEPHAGGFRPGIDTDKLNQIGDQLDTDDFILETLAKGP